MTNYNAKNTIKRRICYTTDLLKGIRATAGMEDRPMEYQVRVLIKRGLMYTNEHRNELNISRYR